MVSSLQGRPSAGTAPIPAMADLEAPREPPALPSNITIPQTSGPTWSCKGQTSPWEMAPWETASLPMGRTLHGALGDVVGTGCSGDVRGLIQPDSVILRLSVPHSFHVFCKPREARCFSRN